MSKNILALCAITAVLSGCTSNLTTNSSNINMTTKSSNIAKVENVVMKNTSSQTTAVDLYDSTHQGIIKDGTCIELISSVDMSPMHYLTFRKKDTVNDLFVKFEDENCDVEVSSQCEYTVYVDDGGNCCLELCTMEEQSPITITIDGYEYIYEFSNVEAKQLSLNQSVKYDDCTVVLEKMSIYPNAIVIYLSNATDKKVFEEQFFLVTKDTKKEFIPNTFHTENGKYLIYTDEGLGINRDIGLKIGHSGNYIFESISY